MRRIVIVTIFIASVVSVSFTQSKMWVTAYYAGWMQGNEWSYHLRPQDIDYSAVTHIIHFSLAPRSDGTLDDAGNGVTADAAGPLISRAHAAGVKVLISIGGWNSEPGFSGATRRKTITTFIDNILALVRSRRYDGVDIDWEPISPEYVEQFEELVQQLSKRLKSLKPPLLLTAASAWESGAFGRLHQYFDQINLMTYDMSGAWPGWVAWHNAPIYDGGYTFPGSDKPLPSTHARILEFIAAGTPREKLGIGIDFYGYVWKGGSGTPTGGVTAPRQGWDDAPSVKDNVAFYDIMNNFYQPQYYRWDASAQAAYLSIDKPGSSEDVFVSYDDVRACDQKIRYAVEQRLGGIFIWELGGGWRPTVRPSDPLLRAVKESLARVKR